MRFNEKMIFLMDITGTSNKLLADNINVDPSMISLIRTGRRGKPRNEAHLQAMAVYFSGRLLSLYPMSRLSEILLELGGKPLTESRQLQQFLFHWLQADENRGNAKVESLLRQLQKPVLAHELPSRSLRAEASSASVPATFYDSEGEDIAIRRFYEYCLSLKSPGTIYLLADGEASDHLKKVLRWESIQDYREELIRRGFHFIQILPPSGSDLFYESLVRWMPLYLTGQVEAYYYPRYRDSVFRRNMLLLPGHMCLTATTIVSTQEIPFVILSTNESYLNANMRLFQDYMRLCRRTLIPNRKSSEIQRCMSEFNQLPGDALEKCFSLSSATMPIDTMRQIRDVLPHLQYSKEEYESFLLSYMDARKQQRKERTVIEICGLASPEMVAAGNVRLLLPGIDHQIPLYYTPLAYRFHLQEILHLLKTEPNYHFIPQLYIENSCESIYVRENRGVLLIKAGDPTILLEITQSELVAPFYQYLIDIAQRNAYNHKGREQIMSRLENLIRDLDQYI